MEKMVVVLRCTVVYSTSERVIISFFAVARLGQLWGEKNVVYEI
jgi:hypothetical protein